MCGYAHAYICVWNPEENRSYHFSGANHIFFLPRLCQVGETGRSSGSKPLRLFVSPALGLQVCTTRPNYFTQVLGILMLARQTLY